MSFSNNVDYRDDLVAALLKSWLARLRDPASIETAGSRWMIRGQELEST